MSLTARPEGDASNGRGAKRPLSRRAMLARLAMGSAAAGAAAVLGAIVVDEPPGGAAQRATRLPGGPGAAPTGVGGQHRHRGGGPGLQVAPGPAPPDRSPSTSGPPTSDLTLVLTDSHAGPAQQGPMIIDGNGDLVWFLPAFGGLGHRACGLSTCGPGRTGARTCWPGSRAPSSTRMARATTSCTTPATRRSPRSTPKTVTRATCTSS